MREKGEEDNDNSMFLYEIRIYVYIYKYTNTHTQTHIFRCTNTLLQVRTVYVMHIQDTDRRIVS